MAELVKLTIKELKTLTDDKDIEIIYIGRAKLIAYVDPLLINRVLVNLVINAIQAIKGDVGMIRVGLFLDCDKILIEIGDNGSGIDEEHYAKLFEPGFTAGKKDGTGQGLDICRQIAEAHGGKIDVYSVSKRGTVFTAVIPNSADPSHYPEEHGIARREDTID